MSSTEKMALIFSAFPNPEEEGLVYEMMPDIFCSTNESIHERSSKGRQKSGYKSQYFKKYTTDPRLRWYFISKLDSNYSQELYK